MKTKLDVLDLHNLTVQVLPMAFYFQNESECMSLVSRTQHPKACDSALLLFASIIVNPESVKEIAALISLSKWCQLELSAQCLQEAKWSSGEGNKHAGLLPGSATAGFCELNSAVLLFHLRN